MQAHFILYVKDQDLSTRFYRKVLAQPPRLSTPGMSEFELTDGAVLGLMPSEAIRALLGDALPDPRQVQGGTRAELYLLVDDPLLHHRRALDAGARELSRLAPRAWGHRAAYSLDPDGYVLAFAEIIQPDEY